MYTEIGFWGVVVVVVFCCVYMCACGGGVRGVYSGENNDNDIK